MLTRPESDRADRDQNSTKQGGREHGDPWPACLPVWLCLGDRVRNGKKLGLVS